MKKYMFLLLALPVMLPLACEKETLLNETAIDSKILIDIREYLRDNKIVLACKTENFYPCMNYSILTTQSYNGGNQVTVMFQGVFETDICLTAIGPASTEIDLSALSNGQYELTFINGKVENKGWLKISDSEIILDFKTQHGIEITTPIMKRVPANTYWGSIGYARQSSENSIDQFIDKLSDLGIKYNKQAPGYYFHYSINADGEYVFDTENSGFHFAKGLFFQYGGDESKLDGLIQTEGKELYKDDVYISIWTHNGGHLYNWGK